MVLVICQTCGRQPCLGYVGQQPSACREHRNFLMIETVQCRDCWRIATHDLPHDDGHANGHACNLHKTPEMHRIPEPDGVSTKTRAIAALIFGNPL